jgi:hypothetical protein
MFLSEIQYDIRVVPANDTAFMEAFGRETLRGFAASGFAPKITLERDALVASGGQSRRLVRFRVIDFREALDKRFFVLDDDIIQATVEVKFYDATGLPLKPSRTVDASVHYESNMFDTTAKEPIFMKNYDLKVVGKNTSDDTSSERIDFARALARDLAYQLLNRVEPDLRGALQR